MKKSTSNTRRKNRRSTTDRESTNVSAPIKESAPVSTMVPVNEPVASPTITPVNAIVPAPANNTLSVSAKGSAYPYANLNHVTGHLVRANVSWNAQAGYDRLHLNFLLMDGPHQEEEEVKTYNLKSRKAVEFMRTELGKLSVEVPSREDLKTVCPLLEGKDVVLDIHYRADGNTQVYIVREIVDDLPPPPIDPDSIWS